jgi:hypothetical protein
MRNNSIRPQSERPAAERHETCIPTLSAAMRDWAMRKKIKGGTVETEISTIDGGYVAIRQPAQDAAFEQVCLLSADQLPELIRELQALYDDRRSWQERPVE